MTEVHKVTILVIDHDQLGAEALKVEIENVNYPNDCVSPQVMAIETKSVPWNDEHPLNQRNQQKNAFKQLFAEDSPEETNK